jgi:tRNA dimethylallyltransferase
MSICEEMNAEKFRTAAIRAMEEIHSRGKMAIVVGGSGLYIKALTHGLAVLPQVDPDLRAKLNAMSIDELRSQLADLDQESARKIDTKNRRRLVRALEICLTTGKRASEQRTQWAVADLHSGLFVFRDREELCERINQRVETMFENNVIEEVRAVGAMSSTASQMVGLREIHELLGGKMSISQCVAAIQQATRHYAKRQLTWFRRQTNFEPLNLSLLTHNEAVKWLSQRARRSFARRND